MTDARRPRVRRILLIASLPFALAGVILAVKLFSLASVAGLAIGDYERGDFESSAERFDGPLSWNAFEPWIAWFDRGTARATSGSYNDAIDDLERAFAQAPAERKCDVAVNLSLSWELLADSYLRQGFFAGAQRLYDTSKAVIAAAGEECEQGNAPQNAEQNRNAGEELAEAGERLDEKSQTAEALDNAQGGGPETGEGTEGQLDELERQNDEAAKEKAEQESRDRGENGADGFADRPW